MQKQAIEFYEWVTTRRAGDNLRGDFIRHIRFMFMVGGKVRCESAMLGARDAAKNERGKLEREYKRYWLECASTAALYESGR